jgi:hypothetical protein
LWGEKGGNEFGLEKVCEFVNLNKINKMEYMNLKAKIISHETGVKNKISYLIEVRDERS